MLTIKSFTKYSANNGGFLPAFSVPKGCFCFIHFHSSITLTYKGERLKTEPHALVVYTGDSSKIKFNKVNSTCDIIQFKGKIDTLLSSVGLHKDRFYYLQDTEALLNIIEKMKVEYYNARPFYNQIVNNCFEELILKISRDYSNETIVGYKAEKTLNTFDFDNIWITTESYPALRKFLNKKREVSPIWDGSTVSPDYTGKGESAENPILINNASQLAFVVRNNREYKYFKLTADIYLNDIDKVDWSNGKAGPGYTPNRWFFGFEACSFSGSVDGAGHIIHGLYYNEDDLNYTENVHIGAGLFPAISKVDIKNIGIKNSYLKHYDNFSFGAFFGFCHYSGSGSIEYCFADSSVKLVGADVGGFAGGGDLNKKRITIKHCYSLAKIRGTKYIGAFIADSWTDDEWIIEDSYCIGKPYGSSWKFPELKNVFSTEHSLGNLSYLVNDSSNANINKDTLLKFRYLRNKMLSTISESWPISRMAQEVNFSQSRFCNIYKEIYGIPPVKDLINEKINMAKNMLSYGHLSIGEISASLGYENPTHFSRQFKSITGYSPANYREKF